MHERCRAPILPRARASGLGEVRFECVEQARHGVLISRDVNTDVRFAQRLTGDGSDACHGDATEQFLRAVTE